MEVVVASRFKGPPTCGNGGYVAGLLARLAGGHRTVAMRLPTPLDTPLAFDLVDGAGRLTDGDKLVAEAKGADPADLPVPPAPPTLAEAEAAQQTALCYHPTCLSCGDKLDASDGLRVLVGQLAGRPEGQLAGVWTVDAAFTDADGLAPEEIVWAAIDCPGYYAWIATEGRHGAMTGTMQAEVLARPRAGDRCIVLAWPIERPSERRQVSGVALFAADGTLMARALQVWIRMPPRPPAAQEQPSR